MVDAAGDVYSDDLAFGVHAVGFSRHWKEEYGLLVQDFEQLKKERESAAAKPGASYHSPLAGIPAPPTARIASGGTAEAGHDFTSRRGSKRSPA